MTERNGNDARDLAALEVQRVATLLRRRVHGCGRSQKEVERLLGWGDGYLSQVLTGKVDLKFHQFFAVLDVLGVHPRAFFEELRTLSAKVPAAPHAAEAPRPAELSQRWQGSAEDLRAFVVEVVQDLLVGQRKHA